MDKAILLAVAASVCTATASLCQRKGAEDNETAGFDARLLVRLARRPAWLLGIAAMIGGFIFQITALRYGDLSQVQPILAAELLFVFGYLAVAGSQRVTGRDLLAAAAMSAGIGVFLRLAAPGGGRPHAPASSWLLAGQVTVGVVLAALAVAFGFGRRSGASRGRRAAVLGAATGISWGFMAAVIKELSAHLSGGPGAIVSAWSLYVLLAAGAVTMLLASHALAAGPLAASQPGFTILDPLTASLLGVFLFGEHIRTDAAALAGEALALAVVIAGAAALSRSSLITGENAPPSRQYQATLSSAANALPATRPPADPADPLVPGNCRTRRPPALSPDAAARASRTRPGPAPAAARTGPPGPARGIKTLIPNRLRPDRHARLRRGAPQPQPPCRGRSGCGSGCSSWLPAAAQVAGHPGIGGTTVARRRRFQRRATRISARRRRPKRRLPASGALGHQAGVRSPRGLKKKRRLRDW